MKSLAGNPLSPRSAQLSTVLKERREKISKNHCPFATRARATKLPAKVFFVKVYHHSHFESSKKRTYRKKVGGSARFARQKTYSRRRNDIRKTTKCCMLLVGRVEVDGTRSICEYTRGGGSGSVGEEERGGGEGMVLVDFIQDRWKWLRHLHDKSRA